jgi:hypothetical protein
MNFSQHFRHSGYLIVCSARWDSGLTIDVIQDEKRVWDMPKALVQDQGPRGADSEAGNGTQDFELYCRRVPIVIGTMNTQDNASLRSVPRLHFEAIDIRRYPTGKPKCPHEPRTRQVRSDNRFEGAVGQYSLSSGSFWREVRHSQSIPAELRWNAHSVDRFRAPARTGHRQRDSLGAFERKWSSGRN